MTTHPQRSLYVRSLEDTILVDERLWLPIKILHSRGVVTENSCQGDVGKRDGYLAVLGLESALTAARLMLGAWDWKRVRIEQVNEQLGPDRYRLQFAALDPA